MMGMGSLNSQVGVDSFESIEKLCYQAVQKGLRSEAREKSTSGGVLNPVR